MEKDVRNITIRTNVSQSEYDLIRKKVEENHLGTISAYIRAMSLTGYVLKLDVPEIRELIRLLRNMTNNINQLAKRVNEGGSIYETQLDEIRENQKTLWDLLRSILKSLEHRK